MIPGAGTLDKPRLGVPKYPFNELKRYGDYVDIPATEYPHIHSIRTAAYIWARKNRKKVATRKYDGGMRVYLAEHV